MANNSVAKSKRLHKKIAASGVVAASPNAVGTSSGTGPGTGPGTGTGAASAPPEPGSPTIFDERFQHFMGTFGDKCVAANVHCAVAIVADVAVPGKPLVYACGAEFDVARLLTHVLRGMRDRLVSDITP